MSKNNEFKSYEADGSGVFMTEEALQEYKATYIKPDPEEPESRDWESPNLILGRTIRRPVNDRFMKMGNGNVLVVGASGTGKTERHVIPNILQMNSSYVITDPTGEMVRSLGSVFQEHGYKIRIFNLSDMKHSNRYNPLHYVRDEVGVNLMVDCLIKNTGEDREDFWLKAERLLYSACVYYMKDFCTDESKKNLASMLDMIKSATVCEDRPSARSELDSLFEGLPKNSTAWRMYEAFKQAAGKTMKSVIVSCVARLQPFFTEPVKNLTQSDQLELEKMGDEKTALFLIPSTFDRTCSFLIPMLYSQLLETLYHVGEEQRNQGGSVQLKVPVRFMMDEFANCGVFPWLPSALSTMRVYNISATIVVQDIAQIKELYRDNWKTLVGNCSTILFFGSSEPLTVVFFSEMLTMSAKELGKIDSSLEIVLSRSFKAVLDEKYRYEEHPLYHQVIDAKKFSYEMLPEYCISESVFSDDCNAQNSDDTGARID